MRGARSGSSLIAKMPRLLRGIRPKCIVDLVGQVAPLGVLHEVDLADQVGDRHVRRRELFVVAVAAVDPLDLRVVALLGDDALAGLGHRRDRDRR